MKSGASVGADHGANLQIVRNNEIIGLHNPSVVGPLDPTFLFPLMSTGSRDGICCSATDVRFDCALTVSCGLLHAVQALRPQAKACPSQRFFKPIITRA